MTTASAAETRAAFRDLKILLPARLRVRLHSVKILEGSDIRDVVESALRAYLARAPELRTAEASA